MTTQTPHATARVVDADTEGVEGLTYAWTPAQLADVLGDDDGRWAAELLVVTPSGTFEHGSSTLQLPADPDDPVPGHEVSLATASRNALVPTSISQRAMVVDCHGDTGGDADRADGG